MSPDDRLTGQQVAQLAGVTSDTVRKWRREGKLSAAGRQPGKRGRWLYLRSAVESLLGVERLEEESADVVRCQLRAFLAKRALARRGA